MAKFEMRPRTHANWEVNFLWTNLYVVDGRVETNDVETFDTLLIDGFVEVDSFDDEPIIEPIQKIDPDPKDNVEEERFEGLIPDVEPEFEDLKKVSDLTSVIV